MKQENRQLTRVSCPIIIVVKLLFKLTNVRQCAVILCVCITMTTKKRIYVYGTYFGDIDENQMLSQKIANAMSHMNY